MMVYVTTARTHEAAKKTKRFLERNGVPIVIRTKKDGKGYALFTDSIYGARAHSIRKQSA